MSIRGWRDLDRHVRVTIVHKHRVQHFDEVFDLLAERFCNRRAVSSCDQVISIACWPWWMPSAVARHMVASALNDFPAYVTCEWVVHEWNQR